MDSYTISGVFAQTMAKYGLFAALMAAGILALIAVAAYYAKKRIDIMGAESASRENERAMLISELSEARKQNLLIISNHLAHDSEERKASMAFMAKLESKEEATIEAINRIAESVRQSNEQMSEISIDVGILKDRRG